MNNRYNKKLGGRFLAVADLVWHARKTYMLTRISVPPKFRGQGVASCLLKEILADADAEGIAIHLCISSSGGLDYQQLEAWYRRYGFVEKNCLVYERLPKGFANDKETNKCSDLSRA
jgi:ribosomal protein S18 acetylase RimI-like enzyme